MKSSHPFARQSEYNRCRGELKLKGWTAVLQPNGAGWVIGVEVPKSAFQPAQWISLSSRHYWLRDAMDEAYANESKRRQRNISGGQ